MSEAPPMDVTHDTSENGMRRWLASHRLVPEFRDVVLRWVSAIASATHPVIPSFLPDSARCSFAVRGECIPELFVHAVTLTWEPASLFVYDVVTRLRKEITGEVAQTVVVAHGLPPNHDPVRGSGTLSLTFLDASKPQSPEVPCVQKLRDPTQEHHEESPAQSEDDPVNHPSHYTAHPSGVECIQITEHFNFNLGNAIKYIWRAGLKSAQIEDLRKARWYVDREISRLTDKSVEKTVGE